MYLVDTNVWLERLLDQERSSEVGQFLGAISSDELLITDFSLHSVGIILCRLDRRATYLEFLNDLFVNGQVTLVSVPPGTMHRLVKVIDHFSLDFDDAYQYVAAEQFAAEMVSFDTDFDHTDLGRSSPNEILSTIDEREKDG